jgi:predicted transposase YdaD
MAYAALARHKYEQDVFITVVQLLPPSGDAELVAAFHREFKGQIGHQDYQAINLWELDAKQILAFNNPALLPFTPLMEGGNTEEVLRSCVIRIREEPRALELETILSVFASYVMDTDVIKRIVRWEMNILKESPILQEALAERYETGQREGKYEESLAWLQRILAVRFQLDEVGFEKRGLAELTLEQLESLGEVALTAVTLAEFDEAVNQTKE